MKLFIGFRVHLFFSKVCFLVICRAPHARSLRIFRYVPPLPWHDSHVYHSSNQYIMSKYTSHLFCPPPPLELFIRVSCR